jgi:hypothetical protein
MVDPACSPATIRLKNIEISARSSRKVSIFGRTKCRPLVLGVLSCMNMCDPPLFRAKAQHSIRDIAKRLPLIGSPASPEDTLQWE